MYPRRVEISWFEWLSLPSGWFTIAQSRALFCLPLLQLCGPTAASSAQCRAEFEATLTVAGADGFDALGASVGLSGDLAAVASGEVDLAGSGAGAVHLFRLAGGRWTFETTLVADDPGVRDRLGQSVAVDDGVVVAGAPFDDDLGTDSGTVYVFEKQGGTWSITALLRAGGAGDHFGRDVVLEGDRLVVGAPDATVVGTRRGAVHVFERNGGVWQLVASLAASDGLAIDSFGFALALRGERLLVGAPGHDSLALDAGAAYVFERIGGAWSESAKLLASDGAGGDFFGISVALASGRALVGSSRDDTPAFEQGSAHVFVPCAGAWCHEAKLSAFDGAALDHFGTSVGFLADEALVGSDLASGEVLADAGALYRFSRSGSVWNLVEKLASPTADGFTQFAGRFAIDGARVLGGAPNLDEPVLNSGGAYMLHFCAWEDLGGALAGSSGAPLLRVGGPLVPGLTASVLLTQARPGALAVHAVALGAPGARPFFGGVLLAFPVWRAVFVTTDASGAHPLLLPIPASASGASVVIQSAILDPAAIRGVALSNAVRGHVL